MSKDYEYIYYRSLLPKDKVLIRRGCPNKQCYCTGKCKEIVGWQDMAYYNMKDMEEEINKSRDES